MTSTSATTTFGDGNISADYDTATRLKQLYVNGEIALPNGSPKRLVPNGPPDQKASLVKVTRPRPQAYKGESSLSAIIYDHDAEKAGCSIKT